MGEAKQKKTGKKAAKKKQRRQSAAVILGLLAGVVVLGIVIWIVVYNLSFEVKEHGNYSVGLNADGTIIGFDREAVNLCNYSEIPVNKEDLTLSDEDVDEYIKSLMETQGLTADDFTDAFVLAYLSDMGSNVEEFRETYKEQKYEDNLEKYLLTYLNEHSEVKSYPDGYLKGLMGLIKSIEPNNGFSRKEYYALLHVKAERNAKQSSILLAIFEDEGLAATEKNTDRVLKAYGVDKKYYSTLVEKYGDGFLNQAAIEFAVLDFLKEKVVIKENEQ